jgi:hypothetical protein
MIEATQLPWLVPVVFAGLFVALWAGISLGIAGSGWRAFAQRYPTTVVPAGPVYTARSASFRKLLAGYRNVVRVAFLPEGIHFSVMFPFRLGHQPFLLPWASVTRGERKQVLLATCYELEISDEAGSIRLLLPVQAETATAGHLTAGGGGAHAGVDRAGQFHYRSPAA